MTRLVLLAAGGGVLHFLGFLGFGWWPLALICLVPLWRALDDRRVGSGAALGLGFVFGWVSYAGGYLWLWQIVDVFLHGNRVLAALIWLADSSWFALRYALYALAFRHLRRRGWGVAVAGVPTLVAIEWLYPMLFPVHLGHALAAHLTLVQLSDLGGPLLMSVVAALFSAAVAESWAWRRNERGAPHATWACAIIALIATVAYGGWRIADVDGAAAAAPAIQVGIVQGNLGVREKGADAARDHRRYLEQTRELLAAGPVDLIVWPETVYSRGLRGPLPISGQLIRNDVPVPLLFGAAFVSGESGRQLAYNSALLIGADGVIRGGYRKNLLIPFTEYVPFAELAPDLAARIPTAADFAAADDVPALELGEWRIAAPICYEAVRPAFVRRMVREGRANLLVTLANDAWFGDSQGPWLHLAMARLRAIEQRRYLVRATNSGVSAVIDPVGREIARTGLHTRENLRATVRRLDRETPYARFGDWPGWVAAAVVVLAAFVRGPVTDPFCGPAPEP